MVEIFIPNKYLLSWISGPNNVDLIITSVKWYRHINYTNEFGNKCAISKKYVRVKQNGILDSNKVAYKKENIHYIQIRLE